MPERLSRHASAPFVYAAGATQWIVPHPQFGTKKKTDGSEILDTFRTVGQVPVSLLAKEISPSMFPPRARTEASVRTIWKGKDKEDIEKKLENARFYGEVLSEDDIALFKEMLPNCARILPQHFDSGGFFCAVIERVAPAYYPVFYPFLRNASEATTETLPNNKDCYKYHGRILTNVTSAKYIKELVAHDKRPNDEVVTEGVSTVEFAVKWLKQNRAYQSGLSEQLIEISLSKESDVVGDKSESLVDARRRSFELSSRDGAPVRLSTRRLERARRQQPAVPLYGDDVHRRNPKLNCLAGI